MRKRLIAGIAAGVMAAWLSLADYVPVWAEETVAEASEKSLEQKIKEAEERVKKEATVQNLNELSDAYYYGGRLDDAEKVTRRALQIEPKNVYALSSLGLYLKEQKKFVEAEEVYKKGVDINNNLELSKRDLTIHYNYGILLAKTGREDEALVQFELALKIDPNDAPAIKSRNYILKKREKK